MPPQNKTAPKKLLLRVPDHNRWTDFLNEAKKLAREQWDKAHPSYSTKKGGRPSQQPIVWEICEQILRDNGGKLPRHDPFGEKTSQRKSASKQDFNKEVQKRASKLSEPLSLNTVKKHVDAWIIESSRTKPGFFESLPLRQLRRREFSPGFRALSQVTVEVLKKFYGPCMDEFLDKNGFEEIKKMEESGEYPPLALKRNAEQYRNTRLQELANNSPKIQKSLILMGINVNPKSSQQ